MSSSTSLARNSHVSCAWCGTEMTLTPGRGRRKKYCSASCKQRAYEQRNNVSGTSIPSNAVIMTPDKAQQLLDGLFELRCAAEDVSTAAQEGSTSEELVELCRELVQMARQLEKIR